MSRFNKKCLLAPAAQMPMLSVVSASAIVLITLEILVYDKNELWGRMFAILFTLYSVTAVSLTILKKDRYSHGQSDWPEELPAGQAL